MNKEKLKTIYEDGKKQGFIKNLSFTKWLILWGKMDKEIKQANKKEEKRLNDLSKVIKQAQEIIFKK